MKAIWNGKVIAESNNTIRIEGNHYFPASTVNKEFFKDSSTNTYCPWKGTASYVSLVVDGKENQDAGWYYPEPSEAAAEIKGYFAFWKGVEVTE